MSRLAVWTESVNFTFKAPKFVGLKPSLQFCQKKKSHNKVFGLQCIWKAPLVEAQQGKHKTLLLAVFQQGFASLLFMITIVIYQLELIKTRDRLVFSKLCKRYSRNWPSESPLRHHFWRLRHAAIPKRLSKHTLPCQFQNPHAYPKETDLHSVITS